MLRAGIAGVSGIANIADIADVADITTGIADIVTDIADIITDIAGIAGRVLRTLWWKQVGVYKVSRGCPVTLIFRCWMRLCVLICPLHHPL